MTGKRESNTCYFCGGKLKPGLATIPFIVGSNVVVIKQVPAEVCDQCGEPILMNDVAAVVDQVLKRAHAPGLEVSVVNYEQLALAAG
jgi:YgiT-type zinc finger domain-containing protein